MFSLRSDGSAINEPGQLSMEQGQSDRRLLALAWVAVGGIVAGMFTFEHFPALRVTIGLLALLVAVGLLTLRLTELSLLSRLFVVLYSLPFAATLGYLYWDEYVWWRIPPSNIALCQNHLLINEMLTIVIVGLCGLMGGLNASKLVSQRFLPGVPAENDVNDGSKASPTLGFPWVAILLGLGFLFSWLHAPAKDIFSAAYTTQQNKVIAQIGISGSYLFSYLLLLLVYVDADFERPGTWRKRLKMGALLVVLGYIVVVLQLMRGDREISGLVGAIGLLYINYRGRVNTTAARHRQLRRFAKLIVPATIVVLTLLTIGSLRHSLRTKPEKRAGLVATIIDGCRQNTWTAVALNNLGMAADYREGNVEYLYGQTYLDYLRSLPPGIVMIQMGYVRPMDTHANPARWYRDTGVSAGGMQPAVVPFRNFGILGVLGILFLIGVFIGCVELYCETGTFAARLLYGCVATTSMLWFWYGDMNVVRAVMGWGILLLAHRLLCQVRFPGPIVLRSTATVLPANHY